jgi:hypothetical protein
MDYKITKIEGNVLTMEDHVNRDEWGKPTVMQFQVDDAECFQVGERVKITIIKGYLTT